MNRKVSEKYTIKYKECPGRWKKRGIELNRRRTLWKYQHRKETPTIRFAYLDKPDRDYFLKDSY